MSTKPKHMRFFIVCICSCILSLISLSVSGQSILPPAKTFKVAGRTVLQSHVKQEFLDNNRHIIDSTALAEFDSIAKKSPQLFIIQEAIDVAKRAIAKNAEKNFLEINEGTLKQQYIDSLNSTSSFKIITNGGISGLENNNLRAGTLSAGAMYRLSDFGRNKNDLINAHYLYLLFNAKTAASPDSSYFPKVLLFPDISRRDFVMGYLHQVTKNDWTRGVNVEFSINRFEDTLNKKSFVSQSFTAGYRVQKGASTSVKNINTFVQGYLYYNVINVDPKYADYRKVFDEKKLPHTIHMVGLQMCAQIDAFVLFCNMKYMLNKSKDISNPDLKRFVYTTGALVAL